jgi:hypothetical protein
MEVITMAYGNTYNNNQNNNRTQNGNYYSYYKMNNAESPIDPTCISFTFWGQQLVIGIFPKKENQDGTIGFDTNNGIKIFLNHSKARILAQEFRNFLRDPDTYNGVGVQSGVNNKNLITISKGDEYGSDSPMIVIRHLDENGRATSSYGYQVRKNFHSSIRNYFGDDGNDCVKITDEYNNLDIEEMITLLEEYYKAMTLAQAAAVVESNRFNHSSINNKLIAIAQKLGVETPGGSSNNGIANRTVGGGTASNAPSSYNNSNSSYGSNPSYRAATLDDFDE